MSNCSWTIQDEIDMLNDIPEPSGPWNTTGDGLVYDQATIADATASAGGWHWEDEEDSPFHASLIAHRRFTRAERHKQEQNAAIVVTWLFQNKNNRDLLTKGWTRFANRYTKERTSFVSPWDYACINNTFRRFLSR